MGTTLSFDAKHKKHLKLDLRDKKILYYLLQDARMPFTKISKKVNLSKETIQYRYHQLIKKGVVLQTYANIDYGKLGFQKYHILLILDDAKIKRVQEFQQELHKHGSVVRVIEFSDTWDLEITMLARSIQEFDDLVNELLEPFDDVIVKKDTEAVISVKNNSLFPEIKTIPLKVKKKKEVEYSFDKQDLQILSLLCKDARLSTYKIAEKVKLNADTIGIRIKRLIAAGIINNFTCLLNFSDLDYQGYVFCFSASGITAQEANSFLYFMEQQPAVISVKKILGVWDIKNYVVIKHPAELHTLIHHIKQKYSTIVRHYQTWVIYRELLFEPFPRVLLK